MVAKRIRGSLNQTGDTITLKDDGSGLATRAVITHGGNSSAAVLTLPNATSTFATLALTETFTNKTLTSPKLNEDVVVTTTATKLNYITSATGTTGTTSTNIVFSTSPTLVTPVLGVATATSINKVTITAPATSATLTLSDGSSLITSGGHSITLTSTGSTNITLPTTGTLATLAGSESLSNKTLVAPVLGTPNSGTLTNCTGLPVATGISGLAAGVATFLATPTSANLAAAVTDETGSGAAVFATSPTLVTPVLGVATATSVNKVALTAPATSATLTLADGSTLATSGAYSQTLTATGATNVTLPTTGTLATLAGTETLSNKTFSDAQTLAQIATPSNPSSGYNKLYAKSDGLLYKLDSAGNEVLVGSGSGAGEINIVINPDGDTALDGGRTNDVGDWIDSGTGTTSSRTTTAADIPMSPTKTNAIKILNDGSSTGYTYMRMTLPQSLYNRKLKISWEQFVSTSTAYVSGDFKVELYSNSAANYGGSYTAIALSTDSSSVSSIPALTGRYYTTFDATTTPYLELRITRTAGTANSYIALNAVTIGPGIQPQGAVVTEWQSYTPTGSWTTNTTYVGRKRRIGDTAEYEVAVQLAGAPDATTFTLNQPSGETIDSTKITDTSRASLGRTVFFDNTGAGAGYILGNIVYSTTTVVVPMVMDDASGSDHFNVLITNLVPVTFASGDRILLSYRVPIAEWAGNGVVNLAQNDVEYAYNTSAWNTASDTTSFAYGPEGALIGVAAGGTCTKQVRFKTPIQATDKIEVELSEDRVGWFPAVDAYISAAGAPVVNQLSSTGSFTTGSGIWVCKTNATDVTIKYARYMYIANDDSPTGEWNASTLYWRVKKTSGGLATGFGTATSAIAGLVKTYIPDASSGILSTSSTTVAATDYADKSLVYSTHDAASTQTITLPTASSSAGRTLTIMRQTDASPLTGNAAKIVAITPAGSDQINGLNVTRRLHSAFSYMTLQSTGTHWIITALQDYTITEGTEANVAAGSANTILTLSLSAGSWRIYGTASYNDSGGTTTTELIAGFHSSSNTLPAGRYWSTMTGLNLVQASYNQPTVNLAPRVVHVTGATQDWDLVVFHTTSGGSAEVDMDCSFYAEQIR